MDRRHARGLLAVVLAATVLSGQLADSLDLGPVLRTGLVAFGISALALAVSSDPAFFITARAVQGAGAALLLSTSAAIVAVSSPVERRQRAMGSYLAGFSVAQVSGPVLGGIVTGTVGWRWLFLLGFLIALAALTAGVAGAVPPAAAWGRRAAGRPARQRRHPRGDHAAWPAVAVGLSRDRQFALANLAGFCLCVGRVVPAVVLSLWFQGREGDDPVTAALKVTPLAVAVTVGTLMVARLLPGRDEVVTSRCTAAGGVLGPSTGAFQTVNSTMILTMRPVDRAGTVNGIRTTVQQSAVSMGTALLLSLGTARLVPPSDADYSAGRAEQLTVAARDALAEGHVVAFSALLAITLLGLLAVAGLRRPRVFSGT